MSFASRSGVPRVGGFSTDQRGKYCILWAREEITPSVYVAGRPRASIDASPNELDAAAPPPGCQEGDGGIPWNRSDDLTGTPQLEWVFVLGVSAIGLLWFGLYYRVPSVRTVGTILSAATTVLAFVIWFL